MEGKYSNLLKNLSSNPVTVTPIVTLYTYTKKWITLVTTLGVKILYKTNCVIREEKLIKLLHINLAKTEQVNCI
jgi:hypothetical protein